MLINYMTVFSISTQAYEATNTLGHDSSEIRLLHIPLLHKLKSIAVTIDV